MRPAAKAATMVAAVAGGTGAAAAERVVSVTRRAAVVAWAMELSRLAAEMREMWQRVCGAAASG